jgi:hypothetical protein
MDTGTISRNKLKLTPRKRPPYSSNNSTNSPKLTETTKGKQPVESPFHYNKTSTIAASSAHTPFNKNHVSSSQQTQVTSADISFRTESANNKPTNWRARKGPTRLESFGDPEAMTTPTGAERKAFESEKPGGPSHIFPQEASWESNSAYGSVDEDAFLHATIKAEAESNSEPSVFPGKHPSRTRDTAQKPDSTNVSVQRLSPSVASAINPTSDTPALYPRTDGQVESSSRSYRASLPHVHTFYRLLAAVSLLLITSP